MDGQITGGPAWMDSDRFDIMATMAAGTTGDDMRAMVQSLLTEAFKLRVHTETRELPAYVLTVARSDKVGPQLRALPVDCEVLRAARLKGEAPPMPSPTPGAPTPECFTGTMLGRITRIESGGMNMAALASSLSRAAGRPVLDRTGLTGYFALTLNFATEPGATSPLGGPPQGVSLEPVDAPSLTAAVQEQLGLRLESRRERMDVLVIDGAEQPNEN
jgi:uncharacterized protein (TIGR03435 family)